MVNPLGSIAGYVDFVVGRADVALLSLALAVYLVSLLVFALRWLTASRVPYSRFNVIGAMEALLVGILVNNIATFYNVMGEIARIGWASLRLRVGSARLLSGALAERASEIPVALLYIILASSPIFKLALLASIPYTFKSYVNSVLKASRELASSPLHLTLVILLSSIIWVLDTLRITIVAHAFNVNISLTTALTLTVIHVISRFSFTPAGLGVLEGGFIGYLKLQGIPLADASLVVLGERLVSTVIPSALGALIVVYRGGLGVLKSSIKGVSLEGSHGN